jgi:hypothetical protein
MDANYDNQYNRSILAQYFSLAERQKNSKYVQQNWETDVIRNMPWGNYGEYRSQNNNYKVLSSVFSENVGVSPTGGNIAKLISQKKKPMKIIKPITKTLVVSTAHVGQRPTVPKIIPRQVVHETVSKITTPYINLKIADLEDKKPKPKSGIQLLSRLL